MAINKTPLLLFLIIPSFFIINFYGCSGYPEEVDSTLKLAGKNKNELKKVLNKYSQNPSDSLKYRAACFLIGNMKWHFGKRISISDEMWDLYQVEDSLIQNKFRDKDFWKTDQAWRGYKYLSKKMLIKYAIQKSQIDEEYSIDAAWINADFLIKVIESSFKVKDLEWNKKLSFDEFCEYILPYRFNNEPVFNLRLKLYEQFKRLITNDTLNANSNKTVSYLNKYINNFYWDWDEPDVQLPDLGFYNLLYWNIDGMSCINHVAIQGQILRSIGVPVTEVFTSKWNDSNSGHSWCGLLTNEKQISLFSAIYEDPEIHYARFSLNLATKFFIKTFAAQKNTPYFLKSKNEIVHPIFSSPCIKDITSTMVNSTDVELVLHNPLKSNKIAYFCSFINGSWDPIAWGIINDQKRTVKFESIPIGLIGILCIYDGSEMIPKGDLVKINLNDNYSLIVPGKDRGSLSLYRKFPKKPRMQFFTENIIGTKIESANKSDFSDSEILATIQDTLIPYLQDYTFVNNKSYRYYRVVSPDYQLNIAELEFLTDRKQESATEAQPLPIFSLEKVEQKVSCKIKGTLISDNSDNKAFDHDLLTFTKAKWLGIDLGESKRITKIRLAPRNANNGIVIGDSYELLYWDQNWISIGIQKAQYNFLKFDDVPLNTYYWLRNISNGREEQPFFYKEGKQIFLNNLQ